MCIGTFELEPTFLEKKSTRRVRVTVINSLSKIREFRIKIANLVYFFAYITRSLILLRNANNLPCLKKHAVLEKHLIS